jgi:hypothetical protein
MANPARPKIMRADQNVRDKRLDATVAAKRSGFSRINVSTSFSIIKQTNYQNAIDSQNININGVK